MNKKLLILLVLLPLTAFSSEVERRRSHSDEGGQFYDGNAPHAGEIRCEISQDREFVKCAGVEYVRVKPEQEREPSAVKKKK